MIRQVTKDKATWADIPDKFEAGTRNLEGVIGLAAAIDYLKTIGMDAIEKYEQELTTYALNLFRSVERQDLASLTIYGPKTPENRLGVFSFNINGIHPHDVAEILNRSHIAVRAGHHCAQPLMQCLNISGTVRASLSLYNTKDDIDKLVEGIEEVKKTFKLK
jgi:cysteine desulfurase/selenocysteine lyase